MKISLIGAITALTAASFAQAIPAPAPAALAELEEGKAYYLPRAMVKRQTTVGNLTLAPATSRGPPPTPSTTTGGNLGSVLQSIVNPVVASTTALGTTTPIQNTTPVNNPSATSAAANNNATPSNAGTTDPTLTGTGGNTAPTVQPTTTGGALSSALNELTNTLLPTTTPTQPTNTEAPTNTAQPTATDAPTNTATNTGITLGLSSIVSDLTNTATNIPPTTSNEPITNTGTPTADPTAGPTNPITTTNAGITDTNTNTNGPTAAPPSTTPAGEVTNTSTNINTSIDAQPPSTTQGPAPGTTDITTNPGATTPGATTPGISGPGTGTTEGNAPSTTAPAASPTDPSVAPTTTGERTPASSGPVSIAPTGTNTDTALSINTSILSATAQASSAPQSSATVLPSSLPKIIQPTGGVPNAPDNSTLIQLGFTYGLNYPFVVGSSTAVAQIFSYLPAGVSHGIDLTNDKVVMQYLQPYNTLPTLGYITTLAMAYVPANEVSQLSLALLNPNSALYNNPNPSVKTLMGMIDPSIPLLAGSMVGGGSPSTSSNSGASPSKNADSGSAAGDNSNSANSGVKPSSVGIGVGVVAGAAVYGAAMFLVARRYKKKKARHQRSSSVLTGSSGTDSSISHNEATDLMANNRDSYGTRTPSNAPSNQYPGGRHSRTSDRSRETGRNYISHPVMAENSLGWN